MEKEVCKILHKKLHVGGEAQKVIQYAKVWLYLVISIADEVCL